MNAADSISAFSLKRSTGHAKAARRPVSSAYGTQVIAHSAPLHRGGEPEQQCEHGKENVIIRDWAAETHVRDAARCGGSHQANSGADIVPVAAKDADQLGRGDGGHGEIMAAQPEGGGTDQNREDEADGDSKWHPRDRRPTEMGKYREGRIRAGAEEDGMSDRNLAGVTANEVPCRGGDGCQQHQRADPLVEYVGDEQGPDDDRGGQQPCCGDPQFHAVPSNPCGRTHSTARNSAYTTAS